MPKISVIMPVYNCENYLLESINSILNQSFFDFELIVVDDGSKDHSVEIVESLISKDERIKLIKQANGGPSKARNTGLEKALGTYIAFIDADDKYFEFSLENMLLSIEQKNSDLVIAGYKELYCTFNNNKREIVREKDVFGEKAFYNSKEDISSNAESFIQIDPFGSTPLIFNSLWNKLYKRSIIESYNIKFDEELMMGEDYCFNIDYLDKINSLTIISEITYQYFINASSISTRFRKGEFFERLKCIVATENYYKTHTIENSNSLLYQYIVLSYSCFINLFLKDNKNSLKENRTVVKEILHTAYLQDAVKHFKAVSLSQKISLAIIKTKNISLIMAVSYVLYLIRAKK